jgi:hypothetical protein
MSEGITTTKKHKHNNDKEQTKMYKRFGNTK